MAANGSFSFDAETLEFVSRTMLELFRFMHTYLRQSRLGIVRIFSLSILTGVLGGKLSDWVVDALEGDLSSSCCLS